MRALCVAIILCCLAAPYQDSGIPKPVPVAWHMIYCGGYWEVQDHTGTVVAEGMNSYHVREAAKANAAARHVKVEIVEVDWEDYSRR